MARAMGSVFDDPELVLFDQPVIDGPLFFQGSNYKAVFDAGSWSFVARPAAGAPGALPIHFRTSACTIGHAAIDVSPVGPARDDRRVEYRHPEFTEVVEMRGGSVEQSYRFDSLPERGELRIAMQVDTERAGEDLGHGVVFRSDFGDVTYAEAVAIDAAGRRIVADTDWSAGQITIRVPASFVANAQLPIVVDPTVANVTVYSHTSLIENADLAWDETSQSWAVVFGREFSVDDFDVYVQRFDADMVPIGGIVVIDATLDLWRRPRIAGLACYGKFLVVAQVSTDQPPPRWIAGRVMNNAGALTTGQFDIARAGVNGHFFGDKYWPEVGGDPYLVGPTYFTVVWERVASATDHDIHLKQVTEAGVLRSATPTLIDNSPGNESAPSISKSDGPGPTPDQRFVVCYQRTYGPTDEDIRGALVTWDGQIALVGGASTFPIDSSALDDWQPQVSTPTDGDGNGTRHFMCAYSRSGVNGGDVVGSVVTIDGVPLASANLTMLEGDPVRAARLQSMPSVAADGVRFAVAYTELAGSQLETRISLFGFAWNTNLIVPQEVAVPLGFSGASEFDPELASVYDGSGSRGPRYAVAVDVVATNQFSVHAATYDGLAPGAISFRPTGCGSVTISASGPGVVGQSVEFFVNTPHPLSGFVFGLPQPAIPIPPCPSCQLGVNGSGVIVNPLLFVIPPNIACVGVTVAVQGFTFAGGPCLGQIAISDTLDMIIQ